MQTFGIVAELDVPCDIGAGVFACRVDGAVDSLDLEGDVEGLGLGIVETRSGVADGSADSQCCGGCRERGAGVLGAMPLS